MRGRHLPEGSQAQIMRMRSRGVAWKKIAKHFGVSCDTVRCAVDEAYRLRRNELTMVSRRSRSKTGIVRACVYVNRNVDEDARTKALRVPRIDSRDITGRLFGDPLPGMSALDRRRQQEQRP